MFSIEDAPVHGLVNAGALGGYDLAGRGGPLGRLAVDTAGDVFSADSKIAGGHVPFMRALELLGEHIGAGLDVGGIVGGAEEVILFLVVVVLVIVRLLGLVGRGRRKCQESVEEDQAEKQRDKGEPAEKIDKKEPAKGTHPGRRAVY